MNYIIFADTNVFLDAFLNRQPSADACEQLLRKAEKGKITLFTSPSCLLTVLYFLEKGGVPKNKAAQIIEEMLNIISLVSVDKESFINGLHAGFFDLEDAIQYYTALKIKGMNYFITSNIKDFKKAEPGLPVISPKNFMAFF